MHCTVRLGRSERVCLRGGSISGTLSFDASKVLALLSMWGVADLRKLEEVRVVHTEEVY